MVSQEKEGDAGSLCSKHCKALVRTYSSYLSFTLESPVYTDAFGKAQSQALYYIQQTSFFETKPRKIKQALGINFSKLFTELKAIGIFPSISSPKYPAVDLLDANLYSIPSTFSVPSAFFAP